jgi:ribosome-associated protein
VNVDTLISELIFKAVRSSGSGGQHVNKVSSKMELHFNLDNSESFSDEEKQLLLKTLSNRLTKDNRLILQCDETRSQHKNKELVIKRFLDLIKEGLIVPKKRKPTKISKSIIRKRKESKRKQSQKKVNRKTPDLD